VGGPRWKVAAQCDEMADAVLAIGGQRRPYALARRTDAGNVRRSPLPGALDLQHGRQGAVPRRAARTEGHGKEFGAELGELLARCPQPGHALGRRRGEEFEAEDAVAGLGHRRSRLYATFLSSSADSAHEMML